MSAFTSMDSAVPAPRSSRLVCWNAAREIECRRVLEAAGLAVDDAVVEPSKLVTHIRRTQPDVVVIDMERQPSHGRAVGVTLRSAKSTRAVPLVFLGESFDLLRRDIPDANCGPWSQAAALIASARPGVATVVPHMKRFAASPLEKKLGINGPVAVIGAPAGFRVERGHRGASLKPDEARHLVHSLACRVAARDRVYGVTPALVDRLFQAGRAFAVGLYAARRTGFGRCAGSGR